MKIRIEDVSFSYPSGVRALDSVDLNISSGELLAIVGENGAGKTTLVKMLNGLLHPTQGQVFVGEWNTANHSPARLAARVGFLFQNPDEQLFERNVHREVAFGPRNLGFGENKIRTHVRAALKQVGLQDKLDVNPYDLLPHERKLLALASTLAMETPVLVLDEPAIGQDAAGRELIAGILRDLHKSGRTLVLISHDLDFCAELAERAIVMAGGRILADGPASEIFAQTETLERAAVHPPQLVRLAQALKLPGAPLNVRQFLKLYSQRKGKKR